MSQQLAVNAPAPRFPFSRGGLAATFDACRRSPRARWHRFLGLIEPWYDWGTTNTFRLDQAEPDLSDESEGDVYRIELQWLGLHFGVTFGRIPPKVGATEIAARKRHLASRAAA